MPREHKLGNTSPEALEKAAAHVSYEIRMLVHAASWLHSRYASPRSDLSSDNENMALESFLLHYRNLRAFLCPKLQKNWPDDIQACHYLGKYGLDVVPKRLLAADKAKLDKMLAHLSYTRDRFIEARNYHWEVAKMSLTMLKQLEAFFTQIPKMRAWFPDAEFIAAAKRHAVNLLATEALFTTTTFPTGSLGPADLFGLAEAQGE